MMKTDYSSSEARHIHLDNIFYREFLAPDKILTRSITSRLLGFDSLTSLDIKGHVNFIHIVAALRAFALVANSIGTFHNTKTYSW
jgi:hypothetical protein